MSTSDHPPIWLSGIVVFANLVALADLPYGYYQLLRIVVTAYAVWVAVYRMNRGHTAWLWIFGLLAVLFNPIVKIHMARETHFYFNLLTIGLIVMEAYLSKRRSQ